ncbi:helix-turn-helix domain-containing protein [Listeria monocytogenes]|nr:helix-turn-helix domain-containing protein [Listeria monocytogenes]
MTNKRPILPFAVIVLATHGDVIAINRMLKHFEHYIIKLSQITVFDDFGVPRIQVEEEIKRSLETKLITAVLKFDLL